METQDRQLLREGTPKSSVEQNLSATCKKQCEHPCSSECQEEGEGVRKGRLWVLDTNRASFLIAGKGSRRFPDQPRGSKLQSSPLALSLEVTLV